MSQLPDEIKEKIDLVDFIRSYVSLVPAGKNFKGLCPFHKEKTPSFIVSPERQIWHCFGCGVGGDVIKFMMLYENLEFFEALRVLAEKIGLDFQKIAAVDQRRYQVLYAIHQSAKEFFRQQLGQEALQYLEGRGLKKTTIEEFELGFAPDAPDALTRYLLNAGYTVKDLELSGLSFKTDRGTYWDRFRGRIIFPINNAFGKTVAFTGRILPIHDNSNVAKYLNSPETPIFVKSKVLFGFDKAKNYIREVNEAVLVEGQMDFLMMWQDGIKNIVATSGTALTIEHLKSLRRVAETLITLFDSDSAGQAATERAIDLAEASDFTVKVLTLPDKDPADFIYHQPGTMKVELNKALPALEYYLNKYEISRDYSKTNLAEFKKRLRLILSKIKHVASSVERGYWLKELEKRSGIGEYLLLEELKNLQDREDRETASLVEDNTTTILSKLSRQELIADQLISFAFTKKDFLGELSKYREYLPESHRRLLNSDHQDFDNLVLLRSSLNAAIIDDLRAQEQFSDLLRQLQIEHWKDRRREARCRLEEAQKVNNDDAVSKILQEIDNINRKLQNLGI